MIVIKQLSRCIFAAIMFTGCGQVEDLLNQASSASDPNYIIDPNAIVEQEEEEVDVLPDGEYTFMITFDDAHWDCDYELDDSFSEGFTSNYNVKKYGNLFELKWSDEEVEQKFMSRVGSYENEAFSQNTIIHTENGSVVTDIFNGVFNDKNSLIGSRNTHLAGKDFECTLVRNFTGKRFEYSEDTEAPDDDSEFENSEETENGEIDSIESDELQCPEKIYTGLSKTCVLEILGEPDRTSSYTWSEWWYYEEGHPANAGGYLSAYVYFRNGRIVEHSGITSSLVDLTR